MATFLITLREGLEAALIIAIILAYLARSGHRDLFRPVWVGVASAIVISLLAGTALFLLVGELEGRSEALFEGLAMLTAAAVLSYMVVWMKRQAAHLRAEIEAKVQKALQAGSGLALGLLALVAVGREGIETVLFLLAATRSIAPGESALGGVSGLLVAIILGYLVYQGSHRLNLRLLFNITGLLLILFAAGLLALGLHELQEAGVFPVVKEALWDTSQFLPEKTGLGSFLKSLFGYNSNPELLEVLFYLGYLGISLFYFFRHRVKVPSSLAKS